MVPFLAERLSACLVRTQTLGRYSNTSRDNGTIVFDDRVTASSVRLVGGGNAILEARSPHQSHIVSVAGGPAFFISGVTLRGATGDAGFQSANTTVPMLTAVLMLPVACTAKARSLLLIGATLLCAHLRRFNRPM